MIDGDEYNDELNKTAKALLFEAEKAVERGDEADMEAAIAELADGVARHTRWFVRSDRYSTADFGSIVLHSDADPDEYGDWRGRINAAHTAKEAVVRAALGAFIPDVIERAKELRDLVDGG